MDLMDKVTKPLENYISFEDFICQLSQNNNQPLHSVVSFLIHYDIQSVGYYYIFNYEIMPENSSPAINRYLRKIQDILFMHNEDWIYEGNKSFQWLCADAVSMLPAYIRSCPYNFFKKSELLLFPPLADEKLINFEIVDVPNTPFNNAIKVNDLKTKQSDKERIAELEKEVTKLRMQLDQQTGAPVDEIELNPKTQTAVTRLLNVLFHKAQLDITAHKGTTNKNIVNSSISLNTKITEKPVSHWIKQVQQLRIDTQTKDN